MPNKTFTVIAVLAALICVFGAFVLIHTDEPAEPRTFEVSYDNLKGADNSSNPLVYTEGDFVKLEPLVRPGEIFGGWYLEPEFLTLCMELDQDVTGDITLYAKWQDNIVGRQLTYRIGGTVQDGIYNTYGISGERTITYRGYDEYSGYFINCSTSTVYDYGYDTFSEEDTFCDWNHSRFFDCERIALETIDTRFGPQECEITAHHEGGYCNRIWIGIDDRIVYKAEEKFKDIYGDAVFTYTLNSRDIVDVDRMYRLTVFTDAGITTTGTGIYEPGSEVTLKADTGDGVGFMGWFDDDMNLVSEDRTLVTYTGWEDLNFYALND